MTGCRDKNNEVRLISKVKKGAFFCTELMIWLIKLYTIAGALKILCLV